MFGKSKEEKQQEKTLKQLKKKQQQFDFYENQAKKLKEEMIKMGKLALRGGKVVKADDTPMGEQMQQAPPGFIPAPPSPQAQELQQPPAQQPPQFQQPPGPNPYPQQPIQQPVQQTFQQPVQEPQAVEAKVILVSGEPITVTIPVSELAGFIRAIDTSINDQTVIELGQYRINGRNIVYYVIG